MIDCFSFLLIATYFILGVFIQVVTGSCALIFIVIAENWIRNNSLFFVKSYVIIRYFLGCKNANLCISGILFLFSPELIHHRLLLRFSSYFLCHVAEQVKKYGLLLLGFTPVNRSDWFLREK